MADRIQMRRDTLANWTAYNPILLEGEHGYVLDDANLFKMGDGVHAWNDLPWRGYNGNILSQIDQNADNAVPSSKAVADYVGRYEDNPEFLKVETDREGKILWGITIDGNIHYGAGVPRQVIDYINKRIAEFSPGEYSDIVAFLDNLEKGDKTLKTLLNEKVDKEENKSLINAEYASTKSATENPEFIEVTTDSEDKILEGTKKDGTKVIGGGLNVSGSASVSGYIKVLGSMEVSGVSYEVIKNPEYLAAWLDASGKVLFGLKADGKTYVGDANFLDDIENIKAFLDNFIDKNIDWDALTSIAATENPEFIEVTTDNEGKILEGIKQDGTKVIGGDAKVLGGMEVSGVSCKVTENPECIEAKIDAEGKVISYRKPNGTVVENVGIETKSIKSESYNFSDKNAQEIKDALNRIGFTTKTPNDHSNQDSIQIPEPHLAVINITNDKGEAFWPTTKTTDAKYWMEFYDGSGNYFKKRIIFNAQGNSSLFFDKKNGSIDICNDEWEGDDTCNIRFGKWTACDSFHLKAYYFDLFKGNGIVAYKIVNQIMESRDFNVNRPWKKELISADDKDATKVGNPSYSSLDNISLQIDNGARCVPDGFPAIIFLNGEFYGIYAFSYKKHRSNYNMDKATPEHIHLDGGELTSRTIFGGTVSWAAFEIRNPKYLVYKTPRNTSFDSTNAKQVKNAYQYDADVAQAEIAGTDSPLTFDAATTYTLGQIVLYKNRQYMAMRETTGNTPTQNKKPKKVYDDAAANGYWIDITYTNKVKQYILDLSNRMSQITSAVNPKEELQKYFDLDNIVDYELYVTLTHNIDAQGFNWQLCSWNGERWYFCVWDAERIWGQVNTFNYLDSVPSEGTLLYGNSAGTPNAWVNDNCKSELKQRWTELVSQKIADKEHIICLIKDWMDRVGSYFYEKEYEKWPLSPCNRDSKFNKTSWKLLGQHSLELPEWNQERTYYKGNETREGINIYKALSANTNKKPSDNPLVWELLSYKEGVQYNVGDRLIVGSDFTYEVECIESTSESPLLGSYSGYPADLGYHDNIWRLYDYISKWIDNLNIYFNSLNV